MTRHCHLLQVGQIVRVEHVDGCYKLTVLPGETQGMKVVEKAEDYVVIDDSQSEVMTRIPLHLIRTIGGVDEPAAAVAA